MTESTEHGHGLSILDGTTAIINRHLFGNEFDKCAYHHRKASNKIRPLSMFDGNKLLFELLEKIEANLSRTAMCSSSIQNWRTESPRTTLSPTNGSKEVRLERRLAGRMDPQRWWNQMPIASGLIGPNSDRRRAVDLVHCAETGRTYDFIELKIASDTPLYALMEIVMYGLIYIAARGVWGGMQLSTDSKASPVLSARRINLRVLAPRSFFDGCQLGEFERHLNQGFEKLLTEHLPVLEMMVGSYWHEELQRWTDNEPDMSPGRIEDLFDVGSWQPAFGNHYI